MPPRTLYHGPLIHSLSRTHLEARRSALICVSPEGIIEWVEDDVPEYSLGDVATEHGVVVGRDEVEVVRLEEGEGEFLCPGLVDTHTHAPQYPNIGLGGGLQLLDWLDKLTFPEEKKYGDLAYAKKVYTEVVKRNLGAGTTTCCYYATTHLESSVLLAEICFDKGQRAFVGKCCMDRYCPPDSMETTSSSIATTRSFVSHLDTFPSGSNPSNLPALVQPILTPRFAISSTPQLLSSLGELAASRDPPLLIQTHMSESLAEVKQAFELFPECKTYAGIYEASGLLKKGTILAHCIHLNDDEREVIRRTGAGVSHCPTSNLHLDSGLARVRQLLDLEIRVGLGTDCSGGYALGILSSLRAASALSKCISFTEPSHRSLSLTELFYMATLGGASLCNLDDRIGNLTPGKEFDALRIRPTSPGMWVGEGEEVRQVFERWVWCGDDRDVKDVWVRGRRVGGVGGTTLGWTWPVVPSRN